MEKKRNIETRLLSDCELDRYLKSNVNKIKILNKMLDNYLLYVKEFTNDMRRYIGKQCQ